MIWFFKVFKTITFLTNFQNFLILLELYLGWPENPWIPKDILGQWQKKTGSVLHENLYIYYILIDIKFFIKFYLKKIY